LACNSWGASHDSARDVIGDEGFDLVVDIARQAVVLEQNPVLERLTPAFGLSLDRQMIKEKMYCAV